MFRFLYGKVDIYLLARNALTSVQMLEKHYLAHVEGKMKIAELQSWEHGAVYQLNPSAFPPRLAKLAKKMRNEAKQSAKS